MALVTAYKLNASFSHDISTTNEILAYSFKFLSASYDESSKLVPLAKLEAEYFLY